MPSHTSPSTSTESKNNLPCHHIVGLNDLFHEPVGADQDNFPVGCTMVLSGPPGAGKTTFALGLVRSMLCGAENEDATEVGPASDIGQTKPEGKQAGSKSANTDNSKSKTTTVTKEEEKKATPKHIVYYISTEVNRERLRRMFATRGWFADDDTLFRANPDPGKTTGLHVINPPLEIERPVKSSEELVNFIVRQIAVQPPPEEGQFVFIVVDSITSLFKDTEGGDSRRQIHELVFRLRGQFSQSTTNGSLIGSLGMILMLSEQGLENIESPGLETYVADFVFTLGLKSLTMGTRLRTLEITKSQGANMMMGTHTWHIVTEQSLNRLIAGETLKKKVCEKVTLIEGRQITVPPPESPKKKDKIKPWGTIMVASRPYFHPFKEKVRDADDASKEESSGICGLDEMLRFDPDYWFMDPQNVIRNRLDYASKNPKPRDSVFHTSIKAGNVTMLVGEPGTGKTSLCYHVIASHLAQNNKSNSKNVALLVGFEHDFSLSFQKFGKKFHYGPKGKFYLDADDCKNCEFIYRPRSGLHFNLLLLELRAWLDEHKDKNKRVAIDGISHLASTHTRQEFSKMLDALVALFAEHPRDKTETEQETAKGKKAGGTAAKASKASLFLTYEALQNDSVLDPDTLRLPAHNIIRFSHKVIEDMRRTAVTVIKSSHPEYDNMVRELVLDHEAPSQTHIRSGFDAYSGLLAGRVRKAEVVLQLFQENAREEAYNRALRSHLNDLLPYRIVLRDFSRFDITSALDGKSEHVKVPSGDVLVAHTDEWWLAHKVQVLNAAAQEARALMAGNEKLTEAEAWRRFRMFAADHQLTKLAGFVSVEEGSPINPGDFWCFEMEKAWEPGKDRNTRMDIGPYGLPSYLDFGMLCVHRDYNPEQMPLCHTDYTTWEDYDHVPWHPVPANASGKDLNRKNYADLLTECLLPWCAPSMDGKWFVAPSASGKSKTLVDLMKTTLRTKAEDKDSTVKYGFAWDSRTPETAACFLYELAWAFGGAHDLFAKDIKSEHWDPVCRDLNFIGFLVHSDLMPVCPTLTDTAQSLFSRHYFSTYTDVVNRALIYDLRKDKMHLPSQVQNPLLISLGFMPPGPKKWQSDDLIKKDGERRRAKLVERRQLMMQFKKNAGGTKSLDTLQKVELKKTWEQVRRKFQDREHFTHSPNPHDIDELERWKEFRSSMQNASTWHEVLAKGTAIAAGKDPKVGGKGKALAVGSPGKIKLRTGYGCCGAWVVGVKSPTGAPGLAQVLLQEITSLNFAKKRARMGAGMPARQDFYRYYGDRPVTGMEYLTWSEMLMYLGSTARRRDRIYAPPVCQQL